VLTASDEVEVAQPDTTSSQASWRRHLRNPYLTIWPATLVLFAVSPLIAPGSMGVGALQGMLPFAAFLAIVSIGQTLVIQQRGLDLSVPGVVSLSAIVVVLMPSPSGSGLATAIVVALGASGLAGMVSGLAVTRLGITPLVATLAVNALLLGTVLQITRGGANGTATQALTDFAVGRVLGIPHVVIVAVVATALVAILVRVTRIGRTFVAVGTSAAAGNAAGMQVRRYTLTTYIVASVLYGLAGILLAGYLRTPGLTIGNSYLLPSIAAVVLGGTSLAGGAGSVLATGAGALFLTQLQQVVFAAGAPTSVQLLIQSSVIGIGMAVRTVSWRHWWRPRGSRPVAASTS
jgi:ribose transport system permease protein